MVRTVYYAASSVDGFIASADGSVAWLDPFSAIDFGYDEFFANVGAVVLGRSTYERSFALGLWPYLGRPGLVVTSRALQHAPEGVRPVSVSELPAAIRELRAEVKGDIWIVGGGKTAGACLDAGAIDELELYVVPRLLGDGVPVLARRDSLRSLRLIEALPLANQVTKLRYAME